MRSPIMLNSFQDPHSGGAPDPRFSTLASRSNTMNLHSGDRIGYRGQTQYNETYDESEPGILDNPQPLTHMSRHNELELNVHG